MEAMFLPEVFRRRSPRISARHPRSSIRGKANDENAALWLGDALLAAIGLALALAILLGQRTGPRLERGTRITAGFVIGLIGAILWFLAMVTAFDELRENEILLVLWPS